MSFDEPENVQVLAIRSRKDSAVKRAGVERNQLQSSSESIAANDQETNVLKAWRNGECLLTVANA
jgi:hypothetical protein